MWGILSVIADRQERLARPSRLRLVIAPED
jgi:hypothetical protein